MTDNELLLAISDMIDKKLKPATKDMQDIKKDIKELKTKTENIDAKVKDIDIRVKNIDIRVKNIELTQETQIQPQLNTIASSYSDTYARYRDNADKMDAAFDDIELLKKVVQEHSHILQNIS